MENEDGNKKDWPDVDAAEPLPDEKVIPESVITQWFGIPPGQLMAVYLTRADIDKLYNVFYHMLSADVNSTDALIRYSRGDLDNANKRLEHFRVAHTKAINELRDLFEAIMTQSQQIKP